MGPLEQRRVAAVKTADAINAIEGIPVSQDVRLLSGRWVCGELTSTQVKQELLARQSQIAAQAGTKTGKNLQLAEAEQIWLNVMLLYERGFHIFSPKGFCGLHQQMFGGIYECAGQYRTTNLEKREKRLAGRSVWYSSWGNIPGELSDAFQKLHETRWQRISRDRFVYQLARRFPPIWQVHPFRQGNTCSVMLLLTLFAEHHGYYMDQELLAANAGFVRDALVMASLDQYSEMETLERILLDAAYDAPVEYDAAFT